MQRSPSIRFVVGLVLVVTASACVAAAALAKGTPSTVTVKCDASVKNATVTVQLMSGTSSPSPASNQVVLACGGSTKISPLSQPAAAYAWSAFVTATASTFGCGGTTTRGTSATCTNAAGGAGSVTVLAT